MYVGFTNFHFHAKKGGRPQSEKAVRSTKEVVFEALNPLAYNNKKRNRQIRCAILANPKKLNESKQTFNFFPEESGAEAPQLRSGCGVSGVWKTPLYATEKEQQPSRMAVAIRGVIYGHAVDGHHNSSMSVESVRYFEYSG